MAGTTFRIETQAGSRIIDLSRGLEMLQEGMARMRAPVPAPNMFELPVAPITAPTAEALAPPRRSAATLAQSAPDELMKYINAVKTLKQQKRPGSSVSIYDEFVAIHLGVVGLARSQSALNKAFNLTGVSGLATGPQAGRDGAHGGPAFLPWHRQYLADFEAALQTVDPTVRLSYWDWNDRTGTRALLTDALMGGDGNWDAASGASPVDRGHFTVADFPVAPELHYFTVDRNNPFLGADNYGTSLQRNILPRNLVGFDENQLAGSSDIARLTAKTVYGEDNVNPAISTTGFRQELEGGFRLHGWGHTWVGGSMLTMASPNDPMFFLHHANIDRLWAEWQLARRQEWETANPGGTYDYALHYYQNPAQTDPIPGHEVDHLMWPWDGGASSPATYTPGATFPTSGHPHPDLAGITLTAQQARNLYDFLFGPFAWPISFDPLPIIREVHVRDVLDPYGAGAYYDTIAPVS